MQTFDLDISVKRVIPLLYVKQRDVGTKILINITNNGDTYAVPANASLSVWYSGTSGEGNYTTIGDKSAFVVKGNTVTVELIMQMLNNPGGGKMCLLLNSADGSQLGLWDIPYFVEAIPGADSEEAMQYYTAFLEAVTSVENAARRAQEAAEKLEGNLVLKKGEGINSIVQALELDEEDVQKGKAPQANAEGSTVFGEYGVVHADNDEAGNGETSMAVNYQNQVYGARSFAANVFNKVFGKRSVAFGNGNWIGQGPTVDHPDYKNIIPSAATVFGTNNHVLGDNAIGTGNLTHANGKNSMTGGLETGTEGEQSVALGQKSKAYGVNSLAGGRSSQTGEADKVGGTAGKESFAWGFNAQARGICSVAFGANTQSTGAYALAGGHGTKASNDYNFGYGKFILVDLPYQAAFGQYNDPTTGALFMIGNGTSDDGRSNAFEVGNDYIVVDGKKLTAETISELATKSYIENYIDNLGVAEGAVF